ncbi:MAG: hypothetical protein AAFR74_04980 [Pseudomonadota bacterium]
MLKMSEIAAKAEEQMKAHTASFINALTLVGMSAWAYFSSETPSVTALIPAGFGVALLLCLPGVKSENKIIAHIAVILTLIVLIALFMPLRSALGGGDTLSIVRVGLMIATTALAFVFFIKSFIDARKARDA